VGRRQAGAPTGYHFGGDDGEDEDGNEDGSNTGERVEVKKEEGEEVGGGGEDEQEVFGGKNFCVFNLRKNYQKYIFFTFSRFLTIKILIKNFFMYFRELLSAKIK
jgi:hypothetical protein